MYTHFVPDETPKNRSANMCCIDCASGLFISDIDEKFALNRPVVCGECGQGHVIEMHAIEEFEFFRLAPAA